MKQIKVCYTKANNLGDAVNPLIIRDVLGYEPVLSDAWSCEITGIGSGLRRLFVDMDRAGLRYRVRRMLHRRETREPLIIWSAGFLTTPSGKETPVRSEMKVASVRGHLSKQHVERLTDGTADCTVGDAGLLASELIKGTVPKKYSVGIIPHRKEKGLLCVEKLRESIPGSAVIDIEPDDPLSGLREIASCECILSGSLHGLIFADSFRIPNRHVLFSDNLSGDGFKFNDYYSVYSLEDHPVDLRKDGKIDIDEVIGSYSISDDQIAVLRESCIEAFNRYLH